MRHSRKRGIALPVTLFLITLMTIMLAALFARVGAERDVAVGSSDAVTALTLAQSGLQRYLGSLASRPADGDSVRYNLTGGYADVVARIVESDTVADAKMMYIIRSTGYVIVPALGATTQGKRTVAQFAQWQVRTGIRRVAALTAVNGLNDLRFGNINVDGTNAGGCGAGADLGLGLRAAGASVRNASDYPPAIDASGPWTRVADTTGVSWTSILNGEVIPDYTYINLADWGWKTHLVQGPATLNGVGKGLLIVTGDLTIAGSTSQWNGVVLVGGTIYFQATRNYLYGIVVSGLNGIAVPRDTLGRRNPSSDRFFVRYCAAYVDSVAKRLVGFAPIRNAWVDNWASY